MLTLLFNAFAQVHQIPHSAFDLALRILKLGEVLLTCLLDRHPRQHPFF